MPAHTYTLLSIAVALAPTLVSAQSAGAYERDFVITAYYSPLPGQCCYVTGSEETDKQLNGHGTHGADGSPVYPGMAAAPSSYSFGTRISLPGIGVVTVHDRGGAIVERDKTDRLDLWMGAGEEGLARALAFGVQHVHGTVYPDGTIQPKESFALGAFAAPLERLSPFVATALTDVEAKAGDRSWSVRLLQTFLGSAGMFDHPVTGLFGMVTQDALRQFIDAYGLNAPSDHLTPIVAAYLMAAKQAQERSLDLPQINAASSARDIREAQRLLRGFGFYKGRTDGVYADALREGILKFQTAQRLVGSADAPGAGRIGPKTLGALQELWRRRIVARTAQKILLAQQVEDALSKRGQLLTQTLSKGQSGAAVSSLQRFLAKQGYFDAKAVNGHYGDKTEAAVIAYQQDRGLVSFWSKSGKGTVGPMTLQKIQEDTVTVAVARVRANGWDAL